MKKLSKFNHNVSFSHKKCPLENKKMIVFKLFQTNDQNASKRKKTVTQGALTWVSAEICLEKFSANFHSFWLQAADK